MESFRFYDLYRLTPEHVDSILEQWYWNPSGDDSHSRNLMEQFKAMHEHCFPVPYDDDFFLDISRPTNIIVVALAPATTQRMPFLPARENGAMLRGVPGLRADGAAVWPQDDCNIGMGFGRAMPNHNAPLDSPRQMIGMVTIRIRPGGRGQREGYISTLGVRSDCRKLGIAQDMLKAATREAFDVSACERLWLHCLQGNVPATAMYLREGFRICDFLPRFYKIRGLYYDANILAISNPKYIGDESWAYLFAVEPDLDDSPPRSLEDSNDWLVMISTLLTCAAFAVTVKAIHMSTQN